MSMKKKGKDSWKEDNSYTNDETRGQMKKTSEVGMAAGRQEDEGWRVSLAIHSDTL